MRWSGALHDTISLFFLNPGGGSNSTTSPQGTQATGNPISSGNGVQGGTTSSPQSATTSSDNNSGAGGQGSANNGNSSLTRETHFSDYTLLHFIVHKFFVFSFAF